MMQFTPIRGKHKKRCECDECRSQKALERGRYVTFKFPDGRAKQFKVEPQGSIREFMVKNILPFANFPEDGYVTFDALGAAHPRPAFRVLMDKDWSDYPEIRSNFNVYINVWHHDASFDGLLWTSQ